MELYVVSLIGITLGSNVGFVDRTIVGLVFGDTYVAPLGIYVGCAGGVKVG